MKKLTFSWLAEDLKNSDEWIFRVDEKLASLTRDFVKDQFHLEKPLFEYSKKDFQVEPVLELIRSAVDQAMLGTGIALVKGLPREGLTELEFQKMIWSISLHFGVPRPQGKSTQYLSEVSNQGTQYRAPNGRGYSSNAKLDFHADSCDLALLACYNQAKSGGESLVSSSHSAWEILKKERSDLAEIASQPFTFSRNQEEASGEAPFYSQPLFDFSEEEKLFGKWNRNRVRTAQEIPEVKPLSDQQIECMDHLDQLLHRPDLTYRMSLEPGDLQLINNHSVLHSRTGFEDFDQQEKRRLLYRIWLATPGSPQLPESWGPSFGSIESGCVRGGIRGKQYDSDCYEFEKSQAEAVGMMMPEEFLENSESPR